jgi:hypothetical protein
LGYYALSLFVQQSPKRIQDAQFLIAQGAEIGPDQDGAAYIVYSGEHGNLKPRAREHTCGA